MTMTKSYYNVWAFTIYSILYEAIIFGYAVFILEASGWWILMAALMSASQLKFKMFKTKKHVSYD